ncbi:FIVAR domain-containing protein, partial [Dietzia sp. Marseille-Q0999]|nr:FIVAR domain-containing protein [Dietzia massiliensis]
VVVTEFKDALAQAQIVLANPDAIQEEVDTAFNRLANAMWKLEFYKGNKVQLQAFVEQVTGLNEDDYSEKTWLVFEEALNNANVVLANENAMQEEVNNAYKELVTAFLNLRLIPDKSLLEDLINQAEGFTAVNYTKASFAGLTPAFHAATAVSEHPNATHDAVANATAP